MGILNDKSLTPEEAEIREGERENKRTASREMREIKGEREGGREAHLREWRRNTQHTMSFSPEKDVFEPSPTGWLSVKTGDMSRGISHWGRKGKQWGKGGLENTLETADPSA